MFDELSLKDFLKKCLFYHKAMNLSPYHFVPADIDKCPYLSKEHCPIWNCAFHYESLEPKALYCKNCNMLNLVKNTVIIQDDGRF